MIIPGTAHFYLSRKSANFGSMKGVPKDLYDQLTYSEKTATENICRLCGQLHKG
jgi:hypothetical protein